MNTATPAVLDRDDRPAGDARAVGAGRFWRWRQQRMKTAAVATACIAVVGSLLAVSWAVGHVSYTLWGAMWIGPLLLLVSLPIATRAARLDGDPRIGRIIMIGALLKIFAGPLLRYWMAYGLYGGSSDSAVYHRAGSMLAPLFRHADYSNLGKVSGTRFIEILTGQIYAFTGATRLGGFMVFSWMSFIGLYFFYRAFRVAYPDGDYFRYALLVFLCPSLMFWPAAIGKEAFMLLVLGLAALGTADLFVGRFQGVIWLGLGMWGMAVARAHMALILAAGLVVAAPLAVLRGSPGRQRAAPSESRDHAAVQRRPRKGAVTSRVASAGLVLGLVLISPALTQTAERALGVSRLTTQTAQDVLDETTLRSGKSGSTFTVSSPNNPLGFVAATTTVMFRPFPFEVTNGQSLITALEGTGLIALTLLSLPRLARLPIEILRRPYAAFATAYTFAFVYAFAYVGNFGILARERVQLLPFVFVLLCMPAGRRSGSPAVAPMHVRNA